jgi:hypothetical protein
MPRKSSTKATEISASTENVITLGDTIDEKHADEFMAEVSAPVEPEKRVELNNVLDSLVPQAPAERDAPTDILDRILATQPKAKRGRKAGSGKKSSAVSFLEGLDLPPTTPRPSSVLEHVDADKEKADVLAKIYLNCNNFELVLRDIIRPNKEEYLKGMPKKSLGELRGTLRLLEQTRSVNNSANQLKHVIFMGASGIEMGSQAIGMKTQGYANMIRAQEEEIQSILREIAMENADKLQKYQSPAVRLTLLMTTTLLAVDARGRQYEFQQMNAPPPPGVEQRYSGL